MKILLLLIFYSLSSQLALGQDISCEYVIGFNGTTSYTCLMTINNPNGFDGFTQINGQHVSGWSDSFVTDVVIVSGASVNIPQIICQQFSSLRRFDASFPLQIQTLSDTSFRDCFSLNSITLNGRITSISTNVFQNNFSLRFIELGRVEMSSIQPQILGFAEYFGIEAPLLSDLPANFFSGTMNLREIQLRSTNLQQFRSEWFRNIRVHSLSLSGSRSITEIPTDSFPQMSIRQLRLDNTGIRQLNLNSFNLIESLQLLDLTNSPIQAIDFNILDRSPMFAIFRGSGMSCASLSTESFHLKRAQNFAVLEPCFAAFDARTLSFSTSGNNEVVNSIRRERIILSIQTFSDACVIFSMLSNWNPNFEICFGVDGNVRSDLHVDGVFRASRSTPGILNSGRFEDFEISWVNGLIFVTNASQGTIFVQQIDAFGVRFIGVRQRQDLNASWIIRQLA